jgi:YesN/AraC family two-component response regulator
MEAGCSHYISKPFTKREFIGMIEEILEETSKEG